jgi:hypothetical protein
MSWRDADSMTCKKLGRAFSLAILEYGRREAGREVYKRCVATTGWVDGETEECERSIESQAKPPPLQDPLSAKLERVGLGARRLNKQLRFVIGARRSSVEHLGQRLLHRRVAPNCHGGQKAVRPLENHHLLCTARGGRLAVAQLQHLVGCATGSPTAILGTTPAIAMAKPLGPRSPPTSLACRPAERHETGPPLRTAQGRHAITWPSRSRIICRDRAG